MSALVRVDSLLAEKEGAIIALTERLLAHSSSSSSVATATALEATEKEKDRLARQVRSLEALTDRQAEELEKFKCDIDVLSRGQLAERERKLAAAVQKSHASSQTTEPEAEASQPARENSSSSNSQPLASFADRLQTLLRSLELEGGEGVREKKGEGGQTSSSSSSKEEGQIGQLLGHPELQQVRELSPYSLIL